MIIKPMISPDSMDVVFNGNYEITQEPIEQFKTTIKSLKIILKVDGDFENIITTLIQKYNIELINKIELNRSKINSDIVLNYKGNTIIKHIIVYTIPVNKIILGLSDKTKVTFNKMRWTQRVEGECGELKITSYIEKGMSIKCKKLVTIHDYENIYLHLTNSTIGVIEHFTYNYDTTGTQSLTLTNCTVKTINVTFHQINRGILHIENSNVNTVNLVSTRTPQLSLDINGSNDIKFNVDIGAIPTNTNWSCQGDCKYTIDTIKMDENARIRVHYNKHVNFSPLAFNKLKWPVNVDDSSNNEMFIAPLLMAYNKTYTGDDFLAKLKEHIKYKANISLANVVKAVELVGDKQKEEIYKLANIYTSNHPIRDMEWCSNYLFNHNNINEAAQFIIDNNMMSGLAKANIVGLELLLSRAEPTEVLLKACFDNNVLFNGVFLINRLFDPNVGITTQYSYRMYSDRVKNNETVYSDIDTAPTNDKILILGRIFDSEKVCNPSAIKSFIIDSKLNADDLLKYQKNNSEHGISEGNNISQIIINNMTPSVEYYVETIYSLEPELYSDYNQHNYTNIPSELMNKWIIINLLFNNELFIKKFFELAVSESTEFKQYQYKKQVIDSISQSVEIIELCEIPEYMTAISKLGIDSRLGSHKYGSNIVNNLLMMERKKIKNKVLYRKNARLPETIYLDTVNEMKSTFTKENESYTALKWVEHNMNINGANGDDLIRIDNYLMDSIDSKPIRIGSALHTYMNSHNELVNLFNKNGSMADIPKEYKDNSFEKNKFYLTILNSSEKLSPEVKYIKEFMVKEGLTWLSLVNATELYNDRYKIPKKNEMLYKIITTIKNVFSEEKTIGMPEQSLQSGQQIFRINLKNYNNIVPYCNDEVIAKIKRYRVSNAHPINRLYLTLSWIRFNVDTVNKSIWINEIQTDMTKILDFGKTELGDKLNDKLLHQSLFLFQFWVVKHYSDYTVILPSYTTRKKLLNGEPSINGYDNPAKKLKFTKGEYKDTPWYNVKKGDGLVWIWSPLTESRQL